MMTTKTATEATAVSVTGLEFDYSGDALPTEHPHSLGLVSFRTVSVGEDLQRPTSSQGCSTNESPCKVTNHMTQKDQWLPPRI